MEAAKQRSDIVYCLNGCGEMRTTNYKGSTISVCPECIAIWLDHSALDDILAKDNGPWPADVVEKVLQAPIVTSTLQPPCPVCGQSLEQLPIHGTQVSVTGCAQHGVWLQPGELARLQIAIHAAQQAAANASRSGSTDSLFA